jgi:hypothetical protein
MAGIESRRRDPLTVYATVFLLVELTYIVLMRETFKQGFTPQAQKQTQRM